MAIERNFNIAAESREAADAAVESDFLIRSGLCPNKHTAHGGRDVLLAEKHWGQECPECGFSTNKLPDPDTMQ